MFLLRLPLSLVMASSLSSLYKRLKQALPACVPPGSYPYSSQKVAFRKGPLRAKWKEPLKEEPCREENLLPTSVCPLPLIVRHRHHSIGNCVSNSDIWGSSRNGPKNNEKQLQCLLAPVERASEATDNPLFFLRARLPSFRSSRMPRHGSISHSSFSLFLGPFLLDRMCLSQLLLNVATYMCYSQLIPNAIIAVHLLS